MRYPAHILDEIRTRVDFAALVGEYTTLTPNGSHFKGLCPFHQEKTPSFTINIEKGLYYCFGCQAGGNVFHFIMQQENLAFPDAVKALARKISFDLTDYEEGGARSSDYELFFRINQYAAWYFHHTLFDGQGSEARDYFKKRGLSDQIIKQFNLGYAPETGDGLVHFLKDKKVPLAKAEALGLIRLRPDGGRPYGGRQDGRYGDFFRSRLMYPIKDEQGRLIGFGGRRLHDTDKTIAKYMNSPESPIYHKGQSIYGLEEARRAIRQAGHCLLVEGYMDCLRLHDAGFIQAVAPLGTALTTGQIERIKRYTDRFIIIFDGDQAGRQAFLKATRLFLELGIHPHVIMLPEGLDPDDFLRIKGVPALHQAIAQAVPALDWMMLQELKQSGVSVQGQVERVQQFLPLLDRLQDDLERQGYLRRLAQFLDLDEVQLKRRLSRRSSPTQATPVIVTKKVGSEVHSLEKTLLALYLVDPQRVEAQLEGRFIAGLENQELRQLGLQIQQALAEGTAEGVLTQVENQEQARLLSALYFQIQSHGGKVQERMLQDCVTQWRKRHLKNSLKRLTRQIHAAELEKDLENLKMLLAEKNNLVRELKSVG